jgi:hypothetical protein
MTTNGEILRKEADRAGIAPRTLEQVKAALEQARKNKCEARMAALMLAHGRLTDEARGYLRCILEH